MAEQENIDTPSTEQPESIPQTDSPPAGADPSQETAPPPDHESGPIQLQWPDEPMEIKWPDNPMEMKWPAGTEGMDYDTYVQNSLAMTVRHEMTYGDILVSTLLAFLIILMLIQFFHRLILGGKHP